MAEPIVIWGAGAIGGTIGAHLSRAGQEVFYVDVEPDHVAAIEAGKLTIEGPIANFTTRGRAATPDRVTGQHKLIILAVKAHHTETATRALAPYLADDGAVVSCQNGLNELVIADIVGRQRTIGSFVNFGADYLEPGRIMYGVRGAVVVGELDGSTTPRITALHRQLQVFEQDAVLSNNIFGFLWGKAAYGAILKSSALTNSSIADFIADPARKALIIAFVREILSVAAAEKATPLGFDGFDPLPFLGGDMAKIDATIAQMVTYNRGSAKTHSGIWRDLAVRKRQTDVAAQLAPVRAAAKRHGVPTPMADTLVELIAGVEQGSLPQGDALADRLAAVICS